MRRERRHLRVDPRERGQRADRLVQRVPVVGPPDRDVRAAAYDAPDAHDRACILQLAAPDELALQHVGDLLSRHLGREVHLNLHEELHAPATVAKEAS